MGPGCVDAAMIDLSRGAARGEEEPPMKTVTVPAGDARAARTSGSRGIPAPLLTARCS
ncbi:hypothetical protein BDI4_690040 [Burkholderia diffusa]|nr:hypothetical protein BDI4_690040 [Burkholderia diffusa]